MSKHRFIALFLLIALVFAMVPYAQGNNVAPIVGTGSGVIASEGDMVGPQNPCHLPFYQSPTGYSTIYMYPKSVAIGDLNCDGLPDIVAIGGGTQYHHLVCYVQDPNNPGSFFNGTIHNSGPGTHPTGVAVGDIDGDGKPDLVFSKFHTYGLHTATVLINTTASHSATLSFSAMGIGTGENNYSVAIGDLNSDGKPDIALGSETGLMVLKNTSSNGSLTFVGGDGEAKYTTGTQTESVVIGDFNEDGKPDLAVANTGTIFLPGSTITFFTNNTQLSGDLPTFTQTDILIGGQHPKSIVQDDFNSDSRPDLAVAGGTSISVFINTTTPGAGIPIFSASSYSTGHAANCVATEDLNGDGLMDLVAPYRDNGMYPIIMTVFDDDGGSDNSNFQIIVENVAPEVRAITNKRLLISDSMGGIVAQFTDAGRADIHSATINWGDFTTSSGTVYEQYGFGTVSGTHTYSYSGTFTITVTVSDDDGGSSSDTFQVDIHVPGPDDSDGDGIQDDMDAFPHTPSTRVMIDIDDVETKLSDGVSVSVKGAIQPGSLQFSWDTEPLYILPPGFRYVTTFDNSPLTFLLKATEGLTIDETIGYFEINLNLTEIGLTHNEVGAIGGIERLYLIYFLEDGTPGESPDFSPDDPTAPLGNITYSRDLGILLISGRVRNLFSFAIVEPDIDKDMDLDGIPDKKDNCPYVHNPGQEDSDLFLPNFGFEDGTWEISYADPHQG